MPDPTLLAVTERIPAGGGSWPLVVLVHGSLDRGASFARVVRRLADLHTVVYDRRGYQGSRRVLPLHTSLDGHIDDLLAVIGGRTAVVVGHSYGGDVAFGAAVRDGGSGIVSAMAYEPPMPWLGHWARSTAAPGTGRVGMDVRAAPRSGSSVSSGGSGRPEPSEPSPHSESADDAAAAAERFFRRMVGDAAWDRLPESGKDERRADGPALQAELAAIRVTERPFDVTRLRVPVTVGCGERSATRHRETVAWLAGHVPGAERWEIPGASHGAHLTHPDAFASMVRSAVERADHSMRSRA